MRKLVLILNLRQKSLKVKKLFSQKNFFNPDDFCFMPTLVIERELFDFNKAVIPKDFVQYFFFVFWSMLVYRLRGMQDVFVKFNGDRDSKTF